MHKMCTKDRPLCRGPSLMHKMCTKDRPLCTLHINSSNVYDAVSRYLKLKKKFARQKGGNL